MTLGVVSGSLVLISLWPLPDALLHPPERRPLRVLDRSSELLYEARQPDFGLQRPLPFSRIPPQAIQALLAAEDRTFFVHPGVSVRGIVRAAWQNLRSGRITAGGSTITQQLVRLRLGAGSRTFLRKMREAVLALKFERILTKEEILEAYLSEVSFGHQAYGINAAAEVYFGKSPAELSLAETALLIGILPCPVRCDPFRDFRAAKDRERSVLGSLRMTGNITAEEEEAALLVPLRLASGRVPLKAPHFVQWILAERGKDLSGSGKRELRTTLDFDLQESTEEIVARNLQKLRTKNVSSAAVVVLDAATGDILAMVGSGDYFDEDIQGSVNVALAPRQPGSALKPFTYALALAEGATPATTVADTEVRFLTGEGNPYVPRNYDYDHHGLVRYREALANSYNIAAVKVLERVGVASLLRFLRSAGITTLTENPEHYGVALTLGDGEVRLLELAAAYGIFAREGRTLHPRALLEDPVMPSEQILDPKVAWLVADILSDDTARLAEFGAGGPLSFDRPVAAKTGTTRNARDNWTIGFTKDRIVGVWVGNADNAPMRGTSGVTGAGPIFHDVLLAATEGLPPREFPRPPGITEREVCRLSGKLPSPLCPQRILEVFLEGTEPKEKDDLFAELLLDRRNGLRATSACDPRFVRKETFAIFPPELQKWAREEGFPDPPREVSSLCGEMIVTEASGTSWVEITKPQGGDSFRMNPLIPNSDERIILEARAGEAVSSLTWFLNGKPLFEAAAPDFRFAWQPVSGVFTVEARARDLKDSVRIEVASSMLGMR